MIESPPNVTYMNMYLVGVKMTHCLISECLTRHKKPFYIIVKQQTQEKKVSATALIVYWKEKPTRIKYGIIKKWRLTISKLGVKVAQLI